MTKEGDLHQSLMETEERFNRNMETARRNDLVNKQQLREKHSKQRLQLTEQYTRLCESKTQALADLYEAQNPQAGGDRGRPKPHVGLEVKGHTNGGGVRVVSATGPAATGGLETGDVIDRVSITFNIRTADDFGRVMARLQADDIVEMDITRAGRHSACTVRPTGRARGRSNSVHNTAPRPSPYDDDQPILVQSPRLATSPVRNDPYPVTINQAASPSYMYAQPQTQIQTQRYPVQRYPVGAQRSYSNVGLAAEPVVSYPIRRGSATAGGAQYYRAPAGERSHVVSYAAAPHTNTLLPAASQSTIESSNPIVVPSYERGAPVSYVTSQLAGPIQTTTVLPQYSTREDLIYTPRGEAPIPRPISSGYAAVEDF